MCSQPRCLHPVRARKLCAAHYARFMRGATVDVPIRRLKEPPGLCSVAKCARRAFVMGLCKLHYARLREDRPMDAPIHSRRPKGARNSGRCLYINCGRRAIGKLCSSHHYRRRMGMPMDTPIRPYGNRAGPCEVEECMRPTYARGLCDKHYQRKRLEERKEQ